MKLIITLFIVFSFNVDAGFISIDGSNYSKEKRSCEKKSNGKCYQLESGGNIFDFDLTDEYENGDAVESKNQINKCGEYCKSLFDAGNQIAPCEDIEETLILNLELEEIYCSKFLRFKQVKTGKKILQLNQEKKDARLVVKVKKELKEKEDKNSKNISRNFFTNIDCLAIADEFSRNVCILLEEK